MLKRLVVQILGRERANRIAGPYHDWKASTRTQKTLGALPQKDLLINIGCGPKPLRGWINLDSARGDEIDVVWDLRRGLPFPNESATAIFGEHVIEHVHVSVRGAGVGFHVVADELETGQANRVKRIVIRRTYALNR